MIFINYINTNPSVLEQNPILSSDTEETTNPIFPYDTP